MQVRRHKIKRDIFSFIAYKCHTISAQTRIDLKFQDVFVHWCHKIEVLFQKVVDRTQKFNGQCLNFNSSAVDYQGNALYLLCFM